MISRHIQYVWKEGVYDLYVGENPVEFVGGAPIRIRGVVSGYGQTGYAPPADWSLEPIPLADGYGVSNATQLNTYVGIAYHSRKVCNLIKKVTVIKAPAIVTVFKGKAAMKEFQQAEEFFPFGFTEDDPYTPFDADDVDNWSVGDLLVPGLKTVGGINYAVWVKASTTYFGMTSPVVVTCPAKIIAKSGAGEDTILTLELGAFTIKL